MIFEKRFSATRVGLFILLAMMLLEVGGSTAKKRRECYVDDEGPTDDPNNIYKCQQQQTCCKEGGLPSCCEEKPMKAAVEDQLKLWGTLALLITLLAVFMCCCRHDGDFCCNRKDGKYCCGMLTKKHNYAPEEDEKEALPNESKLQEYDELENNMPTGYVNRDVFAVD